MAPTTTLDLVAYLDRVGLPDEIGADPDLELLRRLHRAHVDSIPFVSVVSALGSAPSLELDVVQRRLVEDGRGGYCLEHVTLFAEVLDAFGYAPELRLASVGAVGRPDAPPPTHLTVLARPADDPRQWMADVGFGVGILAPVPVPASPGEGEPITADAWTLRVDRQAEGRLVLHERSADGSWRALHASEITAPSRAALDEANRWVAFEPRSPFAGKLVAMRTTATHRDSLSGTRLSRGRGTDEPTERLLTVDEALAELEDRFNVVVDDDERAGLRALLP